MARHGARELAERDGLEGVRAALSELIGKVPGAGPETADSTGPDASPEPAA